MRIAFGTEQLDLSRLLSFHLQSKGIEVLTITFGQKEVETIDLNDYNLFILDLDLFGLSAIDLLYKVKNTRQHTPVIFLTHRAYLSPARLQIISSTGL
jgi:DNA-binding response OmpR family regulator